MWVSVTGSVASTMALYENPTATDGGFTITQTTYNRNRNSSNAADVVVKISPVVVYTALGIKLPGSSRFGTTNKAGGGVRSQNEYVLKQNEDYVLIVVSNNTSDNLSILLNWYEHTSK